MIDRLGLRNFQSHEQTVLEFEPGVNVIIGPSDSGKTSIIRALRWIVWNRPLGDAFRSDWGGDTSAIIKFDDTCVIERLEANNKRHYRVRTGGEILTEEELTFKAFGTEVPEEVKKVLNFSEINLQEQMDSPFLISDNPGQVSRHFNKIANIDKIDSSLRAVESWVRSINSDIKATEEEIKRHEKSLEEYDYLDKMEADIEVLEGLEGRLKKKKKGHKKLRNLILSIVGLRNKVKRKSKILSAEKPVNGLLEQIAAKNQLKQKYEKFVNTHHNYKTTETKLNEARQLTDNENLIDSVLDLYNKNDKQVEDFNKLVDLIESIEETEVEIDEKQEQLDKLEERWHEEAPDSCPLCDGTGNLKAG